MNYQKILTQLQKQDLVDERGLFCHSYRSYTHTGAFYATYHNTFPMPSYVIISIKDNDLCISKASAFGYLKKYYARISLSKLKFVKCHQLDKVVDVYEFLLSNDNGNNAFLIISMKEKEIAPKLVEAIKNVNNPCKAGIF